MNRRLLNEKKILSFYETDKFVSVIIDENLEVGDISKFFKSCCKVYFSPISTS